MTALPPDVVADLKQENARLQAELRVARDRQAASAEILRAIAGTSGDAERSLQQIAETTKRLFDCQSVRIRIAENGEWSRTIGVGASAERVAAEVSVAQLRVSGKSLPGTVLHENRQIHIPDVDNPDPSMADWPGLPPARAAGTRVIAGTPLRREGKAIGALIVYRDRLVPFTAEELALQQSFADQAVIAIENARLFNETQEALERQTATADILKVIASSPSDVQPVFEAIATNSNRLIGGFSTAVLRFVGDTLHLAAFTPTNATADQALKSSFPRPLAEFPPFELVRDGKTVEFTDTESKDVPTLIRDLARLRGYRSMLFTPLMSSGTPIGIISVTRKEPGSFAAHHVQLVRTFADQAVIAIENVRLFDEVQARTRDLTESLQQQTVTADVLKVISRSAFDLQTVLDALLASACRLCEADIGTIRYRDGNDYRLAATFGCKPEWIEHFSNYSTKPDRSSVFGRTIVEGGTVHIPDVLADSDFKRPNAQKLMGFRAALGVPLLREGQTFGVINLFRFAVSSFSQKQIELVQTFADQAVIAIENVRLFDEVQAKTRDLSEALQQQTATADVLKVISRSAFDLQTVLETLTRSAVELSGARRGVIFLRDGDLFRFQAISYAAEASPEWVQFLKDNPQRAGRNSAIARSIATGEIVCVPDVLADPEINMPATSLAGIRAVLAVPLLRDGKVEGIMALSRPTPGPFNTRQIDLVQTFADQAVIAIENVRLFEQVQAKTRDLTEALTYQTGSGNILRVIASSPTDVRPVLKAIVESACELCEADDALVALKDGDDLLFQAQHGSIPVVWERTPINRQLPSGLAVVDRKPVHVHDLLSIEGEQFSDARKFARKTNVRTVLSVPLLRENQSIGAIVLRRTDVQPFSDKQISLLQTFADQAVIAIGNVRLFEQVQERTRELSQSLDELRTAQDRLVQTEKLASLGQLTAGIAHEIKNPLNFVNNFAALSAELTDELNDVLASAALTDKIREEIGELTRMLKDNLERVVQHGKRADSIVKNMLLHSREGSGEHRPADINALLDESLNLAYHGARAEKPQFNVTLRRDFDEMAGMIELFPQEITRVFLNLISNGFYAVTKRKTENGGSDFEPMLSAATRNLGDTVEIRIRDNGTGIPDEVMEKMFNPFFTTKPAGEGTGLGLSMSHDIIVKQHGGRIDVETEPGEFTEFRIVLPRTSSASGKK